MLTAMTFIPLHMAREAQTIGFCIISRSRSRALALADRMTAWGFLLPSFQLRVMVFSFKHL